MLSWLKKKATDKITSVQMAEVDDWTNKLRYLDADAIGMTLAMTAHVRNSYLTKKGMDLLLPHAVVHQEPMIALELGNSIKALQKENNQMAASGYFPWLFTVRACFDLNLTRSTRELWRQLERGFPYADSGAYNFLTMTGIQLDITDADKFPDGFTPDPL